MKQWEWEKKIIKWIKILYNHPSAFVKVNNVASAQFEMKNGTRQGCPLSPLLFVLTLEPLLAAIRKKPDIRGCIVGEDVHKLAAYADDVLLYIMNPRISIPNILAIVKKYGELSNYKVNLGKSEALNININRKEEEWIRENFHCSVKDNIQYLGVKLSNSVKKIYVLNYLPLLDEIRAETKRMEHRPISWIGRINSVKMVLAPKVFYKMQMLPIPLPQIYFKKLTQIINGFVWNHKKPRVAHKELCREKAQGGLAMPEFKKYCNAIARAVDWVKGCIIKDGLIWKWD